jgi:hypothetical protein
MYKKSSNQVPINISVVKNEKDDNEKPIVKINNYINWNKIGL